jgi:hypothetical protein
MTRTNVPITEKRPRAKPDRPHIVEFATDPQCLNLSISDAQGTLNVVDATSSLRLWGFIVHER